MAKLILLCGKIASGKTFYANELKSKINAVVFSTDEATYDLINNEQGEFYNTFSKRMNFYLRKKAVEIVKAGTNVILEAACWTKAARDETSTYCKENGIEYEWHYIDIDDEMWKRHIMERNKRIEEGNGGSDFYLDEGLLKKLLDNFEEPGRDEIDVWHVIK